MALTILSLCSGIGGLELAIRACVPGSRCLAYVERDAYPASVLLARMEDASLDPAPIFCGDLAEFDAGPLAGLVDVVCAGFPCQPFSLAGSQRGIEDERWLFPEIAGIVRDVGAPLVFLENVPGLTLRGLDEVLGTLADLGFNAEWDLFRASDMAAPHRRERWFCMGSRRVPDTLRNALRHVAERGGDPARAADAWHAFARDMGGDVVDAPHGDGRRRERGAEAGARSRRKRRRGPAVASGVVAHADGDGRETDQPIGSAEGRVADGRSREGLADAGGDGPQGIEPSWTEAGPALGSDGAAMGHAVRARRGRLDGIDASDGGAIAPEGYERMADREGGGRRELRRSSRRAGQPDREDAGVAVADGGGREGCGLEERAGLGVAPRDVAHGCRYDWRFAWPPGPREFDRWQHVEAEAQPAVRGVADGIPEALEFRADRLRALGNAVVPQEATLAFQVLVRRLFE